MASSANISIAMVAGEPSGDMLAARLLSGLRLMLPDACLHGIGGPQMAEHGFVSDYPMEKLAVRGVFEVLAHYREIKGIRDSLCAQLLDEKPAAFIGIDAPDFNLDLEIALKKAGIPTLHFISPSIWAWRRSRIKKIARAVSHMLVVFPFEEAIYQKAGIPVTYVGHPLAEVIPMDPDQHGARFIVPMAGPAQRAYFEQLIGPAKLASLPLTIINGKSHAAIEASDAVLVASGTATLEVALYKKPMVISYRMNPASWQILRFMAYQPWVGLPNVMAREFLVPELLQDRATPQALASALWAQVSNDQNRQRLRRRFIDLHHDLMRNTASQSTHAVMQLLTKAGRL